jgi:type II secretory pathway pseudopilin PulG
MTASHRARGEDGVSLVELLTAMTVSALVLAVVTGTIVDALRSERRQRAQVAALNDAKLAFERVTRDIRGADPLRVAAPDHITLDVRGPGGTVRTVSYVRDDDRLVSDDGSGPSRVLVGDLAADRPLFLFHFASGPPVGGEEVDPSAVRSISVQLRVEPAGGGRGVDLTNRVVLRNAEL